VQHLAERGQLKPYHFKFLPTKPSGYNKDFGSQPCQEFRLWNVVISSYRISLQIALVNVHY